MGSRPAKGVFSRPQIYIWLVLALLPIHAAIIFYAFNLNTAVWVEVGRTMGGAKGADPQLIDFLARKGYVYYKGAFVFFAFEILLLLVSLVKLYSSRKNITGST